MIHIKDTAVMGNMLLVPYQIELIEIMQDIATLDGNMVITSPYRPGDPGTHGTNPGRSFDLRFTAKSELICETINTEWEYDHERPSMKCASIHGKNPHIHLKVHPNTKRR